MDAERRLRIRAVIRTGGTVVLGSDEILDLLDAVDELEALSEGLEENVQTLEKKNEQLSVEVDAALEDLEEFRDATTKAVEALEKLGRYH